MSGQQVLQQCWNERGPSNGARKEGVSSSPGTVVGTWSAHFERAGIHDILRIGKGLPACGMLVKLSTPSLGLQDGALNSPLNPTYSYRNCTFFPTFSWWNSVIAVGIRFTAVSGGALPCKPCFYCVQLSSSKCESPGRMWLPLMV